MQGPFLASRKFVSATRSLRRLSFFGVFFLLFFQISSTAYAQTTFDPATTKDADVALSSIPAAYGKVIFRYNETSPNKLYIIGISHRDSLTRLNGRNTAKTQTEVYKIGEWLNRHKNLNLLLPEGFFNPSQTSANLQPTHHLATLNDSTLEKTLADNSHFVNAEMLLMRHFNMHACQVENQRLYDEVINGVIRLKNSHDDPASNLSLIMQVQQLQEERTAAILENIPGVIETEFHKGLIKNKNALFTIGLNHIATIINYLKNDKKLSSGQASYSSTDAYCENLNKKYKDFGVIVIIPRTLAQDKTVMKMTKLNNLI